MASYDVGAVPLVEAGRVVGVIADRDIVTRVVAARRDPLDVQLQEFASTAVVDVSPDTDLVAPGSEWPRIGLRRLPVVKDGQLVGILSLGDVALASASKRGSR